MSSTLPRGPDNNAKPLEINIAEWATHGEVIGLKPANSLVPPESTTQKSEVVAQKQSGIGKKIGEFFKDSLKMFGGGVLLAIGIPVFVATVIPAVVIGAIVKDLAKNKDGALGPDKTSAAGALSGLVVASILIVLAGGIMFPDH